MLKKQDASSTTIFHALSDRNIMQCKRKISFPLDILIDYNFDKKIRLRTTLILLKKPFLGCLKKLSLAQFAEEVSFTSAGKSVTTLSEGNMQNLSLKEPGCSLYCSAGETAMII